MEDALTFALSAPLVTMVVAIIRRVVPKIDGDRVPPLVVALTVAWGGVLVYDGRFSGGVAEFIVATAAVSAAAIGINRLDRVTHSEAVTVVVEPPAEPVASTPSRDAGGRFN